MNIKRELIALAVRVLANETSLVRQRDQFENFFSVLINGESYDQTIARGIEIELDRITQAAKNVRRHREFKKIAERY